MKLSKRFKVVREAFEKHFSEALVLLFFWLILHLFIAAHSVLIPDFTALLSQAHWSFILFFALICATTFLMNEKTYERLFDINLKQTLEIDFAFVVFGKVPLKMRMLMLVIHINVIHIKFQYQLTIFLSEIMVAMPRGV